MSESISRDQIKEMNRVSGAREEKLAHALLLFLHSIRADFGLRGETSISRLLSAVLVAESRFQEEFKSSFGPEMDAILGSLDGESDEHRRAREIMGSNFLDLDGAQKCFDPSFFFLTRDIRRRLGHIPYSQEVLQHCRETHILVPHIGPSLRSFMSSGYSVWQEIRPNPDELDVIFYCHGYHPQSWLDGEEFARCQEPPAWILMRRNPIEDSEDRVYEDCVSLFADDEYVPNAPSVAYGASLNFLVRRERLFSDDLVRTSTRIPGLRGYRRVQVGKFNAYGMRVCDDIDDSPLNRRFMIASAVRPSDSVI
ncbi:MAG: hypothetical protein WCT28_02455 [Patescibacteria group bacterium]|jgi:hypothetical protein